MDTANFVMDSESNSEFPEEYVDAVLGGFAYDPIRLPLTEDSAQRVYNRRTLENIWYAKHDEAGSPFTRQPFDIRHAIPQFELRQQMKHYILHNTSSAQRLQRLEVIPDYTRILSERDMKNLLEQLISDYQRLVNEHYINGNGTLERYWKVLWQRFNLVRLYCQYRAENRRFFSVLGGYSKYLSRIVDQRLFILCLDCYYMYDDAPEVCKEVAKIVDIMGFRDNELSMLPKDFLWALVYILSILAQLCNYPKIKRMVLRIYRRMLYDGSVDYNIVFSSGALEFALDMLGRRRLNALDTLDTGGQDALDTLDTGGQDALDRLDTGRENVEISNEDLYNGSALLRIGWQKQQNLYYSDFRCVEVMVDVVNLCISRLEGIHHGGQAISTSEEEDVENINLIRVSLGRGLFLINSLLGSPFFRYYSKARLQELGMVSVIVRMVKLVAGEFKYLWSSHLQHAINIIGALHDAGAPRRDEVVQVFGDFLRSDIVDLCYPRVIGSLRQLVSQYSSASN